MPFLCKSHLIFLMLFGLFEKKNTRNILSLKIRVSGFSMQHAFGHICIPTLWENKSTLVKFKKKYVRNKLYALN